MFKTQLVILSCLTAGLIATTPFAPAVSAGSLKEPAVLGGLHAWYPLDGNAQDIGPEDYFTRVNGSSPARDRLGKSKGAMYFDGKDDYITLMMDINPSEMPELSVAMWVNPGQPWGALITNDDGNWDRSVTLENRPEIKGLSILAGPAGQWFGGMQIPMHQWRMVIATWDAASQKAALYVKTDRIEKRVCDTANPGEGWNFAQLGKSPFPDPKYAFYYKGSIDNLVVWNRVLSDDEAEGLLRHPERLDPSPRLELFDTFKDGKELLRIGFFPQGVDKINQALDEAGMKIRALLGTTTVLEDTAHVPARFLGEIFAHNYHTLMHQERRAKLGVHLDEGVNGPVVSYTFETLPIYEAGVRNDDIITAIEDQPVQNTGDIARILKGRSPGDHVVVTVQRSGVAKKFRFQLVDGQVNPKATGWAVYRLLDYGMLAAHAGHPVLARQASLQIKAITQRYPSDVQSYFMDEGALILEALATAVEQGAGPAYERMLAYGKLKTLGFYITDFKMYFAPLYADTRKLAYFLDVDAKNLSVPKASQPNKQSYVTLDGNVVQPDKRKNHAR